MRPMLVVWATAISFVVLANDAGFHSGMQFKSARNLTFPALNPSTGKTAAIVQVGSLRKDHERKGFYRIGILPLVVAEDVSIRIVDESGLESALSSAHRDILANSDIPIEIRRLKIATQSGGNPILTCEKAHLRNGGWELRNVQVLVGNESLEIAKASLAPRGTSFELRFEHDSQVRSIDLSFTKDFKLSEK